MKKIRVPHINENLSNNGRANDNWHRYFDETAASINETSDAVAGIQDSLSQPEPIEFTIESPEDKDYPLEINAPYGYAITQVDSQCVAGSCTATIKIGSTPLGGGSNSVSATLQSKSHTTDNVIAAGGTSVVTISSNSSCELLRLTILTERT